MVGARLASFQPSLRCIRADLRPCLYCSSTAPAADRVRPATGPALAQPRASVSGLPPWWDAVALRQGNERNIDEGQRALSPATSAEQAAALLRVIVNVRINGRDPKVRASLAYAYRA